MSDIVYEFLVDYKLEHNGCAPSIVEIMAAVGLRSKNTAWRCLRKLESQGKIKLGAHRTPRYIEVEGGEWQMTKSR